MMHNDQNANGPDRAPTSDSNATEEIDWRCAGCGYLMTGHALGDRCPECGLDHRFIYHRPAAAPIIAREERLLPKTDLYRRNRNAASFLSLGCGLGIAVVIFLWSNFFPRLPDSTAQTAIDDSVVLLMTFMGSAVFWGIVAMYNHARWRHTESVNHYREVVRSLWKRIESGPPQQMD